MGGTFLSCFLRRARGEMTFWVKMRQALGTIPCRIWPRIKHGRNTDEMISLDIALSWGGRLVWGQERCGRKRMEVTFNAVRCGA